MTGATQQILRLNWINLGAPAAERDINAGLADYFIESKAFERVAAREKTIVIGNRGSGKSAIFQILAIRAKATGASVIELFPEDYSYELLHQSMLSEGQGSWAKHGAYAAAWKYLIYVSVMKNLSSALHDIPKPVIQKHQDATQVKRGNKQTGRKNSLAAIKRYIRDNHYAGQPSKLSWLISYLKRIEGVKIGKYEASLKARELEKLYKLEEIEHLLPHLEKVLQSKRVVVLVDELDRGWDASEDAQAFVAGLFQACLSINQLSPDLTVYMSLRQELYDNIPALYDDAQKYRDLIEYVRWDEVGLRRLVCKRLRYNFQARYPQNHWAPDQPSDGYLWTQFMREDFPGDLSSFSYLADRTLFRPREIIQFCSQIVDYARENSHPLPLAHNTVSLAEPAYSDERAKDIAAEFRLQYPRLLQVFEGFRGVNSILSRNDIEEICLRIICEDWPAGDSPEWIENLDPSNLVEILWRIGFLCAHTAASTTGGLATNGSYVGSHQFASLNLRKSDSFQVHPMFQAWLGIGEAGI